MTFAILLLRLASYLAIGGDAGIIQVAKLVLRLNTLMLCIAVGRYWMRRGGRSLRTAFSDTTPVILYLAFLLLAALSLSYTSSVGHSGLQLAMYCESAMFTWAFCVMLWRTGRIDELSRHLANAIVVVSVAFLVGGVVAPIQFLRHTHAGEVDRLGGAALNPNELGILAVIGISCILLRVRTGAARLTTPRTLAKLTALGTTLIWTSSRSSLIALLVVLVVMGRRALKHRGVAVGVFVGFSIIALFGVDVFLKQGDIEEVLSMTGRLPWWRSLVDRAFPHKPLLGFGFQRIWYFDYFESPTIDASMAHNTFLQTLLGLGLVGMTVLLLQMAATIRSLSSAAHRPGRELGWACLVPLVINSLTEFGIVGLMNPSVTLYQIVVLLSALDWHRSISARSIPGSTVSTIGLNATQRGRSHR